MILSSHVSDEKIFLFFSLLGNSIPNLVRLSDQRCTTLDERCFPVADMIPSRERLSEEPKKKPSTIRLPAFLHFFT
jgi:hypothetical protein